MIATIHYNSKKHRIDLSQALDISMPLQMSRQNVIAWYQNAPSFKKIQSVKKKDPVNFNTISFNPHAHGTHTECVGHITKEFISINKQLKQFFYFAELITVAPEKAGEDFVISKKQIQFLLGNKKREAIIIRTLPNTLDKLSRNYSHSNPPYLLEEATEYLKEKGIKHLLIDLPSVDREKDEGVLAAHNSFWNTAGKIRYDATITELIFVPNAIADGTYFLNIQIASFENDATPSKPVLYEILKS
ncbi:cyclase family protein [Flavobacteriaceae bacterium F08102]|nr:cyclase family protein [Flavobacteriaceae bacterium F08102]